VGAGSLKQRGSETGLLRAPILALGSAWIFAAWSAPRGATQQAPCSFDTSAATVTVPAVIFLTGPRQPFLRPAARAQRRAFAEALAHYFQRPPRLEIPIRPIVPLARFGFPPESLGFELGGPLLLPLSSQGRLEGGGAEAESSIPALNEALGRAATRLDSAGGRPVSAWLAGRRSGLVVLDIGIAAGLPEGAVLLMRAAIPVFRADAGVGIRHIPNPKYPSGARVRDDMAHVDLRYVVGIDGRAEPNSMEPLLVRAGTDQPPPLVAEQFVSSAIRAIVAGNFTPARVAGCPVRALVVQRVSFRNPR
jgi:hypothetical protein